MQSCFASKFLFARLEAKKEEEMASSKYVSIDHDKEGVTTDVPLGDEAPPAARVSSRRSNSSSKRWMYIAAGVVAGAVLALVLVLILLPSFVCPAAVSLLSFPSSFIVCCFGCSCGAL